MCAATGVLLDRDQRRHASTFGVNAAQQMARTLGGDHYHVNVDRRNNGLEMNTEAVRYAQHLALGQSRLDRRIVKGALSLVGSQNLNPVCFFCRLGGGQYCETVRLRLLRALPHGIKPDNYVEAAVAKVLGLGVSLTAVAEYRNGLAFEG